MSFQINADLNPENRFCLNESQWTLHGCIAWIGRRINIYLVFTHHVNIFIAFSFGLVPIVMESLPSILRYRQVTQDEKVCMQHAFVKEHKLWVDYMITLNVIVLQSIVSIVVPIGNKARFWSYAQSLGCNHKTMQLFIFVLSFDQSYETRHKFVESNQVKIAPLRTNFSYICFEMKLVLSLINQFQSSIPLLYRSDFLAFSGGKETVH